MILCNPPVEKVSTDRVGMESCSSFLCNLNLQHLKRKVCLITKEERKLEEINRSRFPFFSSAQNKKLQNLEETALHL